MLGTVTPTAVQPLTPVVGRPPESSARYRYIPFFTPTATLKHGLSFLALGSRITLVGLPASCLQAARLHLALGCHSWVVHVPVKAASCQFSTSAFLDVALRQLIPLGSHEGSEGLKYPISHALGGHAE